MKAPILGLSYTEVIADLNIIIYATRSIGVDNIKWKMLCTYCLPKREAFKNQDREAKNKR